MLPGTDFIGYRSAILIFFTRKAGVSIRSDVKADSGICIAIRLMKILFSSQEAEYAQNENSSHHRHQEAVQIKTTDGAANAKHGRQPAADHRTDYPENTGQEKSTTITPRHD